LTGASDGQPHPVFIEPKRLLAYMSVTGTADRLRERPPAGFAPCSRNASRKR